MIPGEAVVDRLPAFLVDSASEVLGELLLTTFRLLFLDAASPAPPPTSPPAPLRTRRGTSGLHTVSVPLFAIERIESSDQGGRLLLVVQCKEPRVVRLLLSGPRRRVVETQLLAHAFPLQHTAPDRLFAFLQPPPSQSRPSGWGVYDAEAELQRMGIPGDLHKWRISDANRNYELCPSYPAVLAVPSDVSDAELVAAAQFRSQRRLPIVTWRSRESGLVIARCSQPMTGILRNRSAADERLLNLIRKSSMPDPTAPLAIIDCRPQANAMINQAMGYGTEIVDNYDKATLVYAGVENIHRVRASYNQLRSLCLSVYDSAAPGVTSAWFRPTLDSTGWLNHISTLVEAARRVVSAIIEGRSSVLVHCTDGWDRTSQVVALAEIMLDPYYRTLKGFQVLIEKEWCAAGFMFSRRTGHGCSDADDDQRSPVFLQWLDAVHQLITQSPDAFEFTPSLLIAILDNFFACRFGNFLFNNERERTVDHKVLDRCPSIWGFVDAHAGEYLNPDFGAGPTLIGAHASPTRPSIDALSTLFPDPSAKRLRFWSAFYLRWSHGTKTHKPYLDSCKQGYVRRLTRFKLPLQRWLVLSGTSLIIYGDRCPTEKPLEVVSLPGCHVVSTDDRGADSFTIRHPADPQSELHLQAENSSEQLEWVNALSAAAAAGTALSPMSTVSSPRPSESESEGGDLHSSETIAPAGDSSSEEGEIAQSLRDLLSTITGEDGRRSPSTEALLGRARASSAALQRSQSSPALIAPSPTFPMPARNVYGSEIRHALGALLEAEGIDEIFDWDHIVGEDSRTGWSFQGLKDDVHIWRRHPAGSAVISGKGCGVVPLPPLLVTQFLRHPWRTCRLYDEMFRVQRVVERIDADTEVLHITFEPGYSFPATKRDFCVLWHCRPLRTERGFVLVSRSIVHPDCPEKPGFIRGVRLVSGWIIRPLEDDPASTATCASIVTYISQLDLKGIFPARLTNTVGTMQPLCVAAVRKALTEGL